MSAKQREEMVVQLLRQRTHEARTRGRITLAVTVCVSRLILLYAPLLVFALLVPPQAFAYGEAITVTPLQGPVGRTVTVTGTGWQDHASRGIDVPIWIGFANQVADGYPDANGNFRVSFTIPSSLPPPPDFSNGKLTISAIIGNGGSADAIYTVDPVQSPGWYSGGATIIYNDSTGLAITWEASYIYQHPGHDNLYWYAKIRFLNTSTHTLEFDCGELTDVRENIRGTQGIPANGSGYVAADETFCTRNPSLTFTLAGQGAFYYGWATFHNVPSAGEVSLQLSLNGTPYTSALIDPWSQADPPDLPPPAECPTELVKLGSCKEGITISKPLASLSESQEFNLLNGVTDLVGDLVNSGKTICLVLECSETVEFPIDFVGNVIDVITTINYAIIGTEILTFTNQTKTLFQMVQEERKSGSHPASPQLCQAANSLYRTALTIESQLPREVSVIRGLFDKPGGPACSKRNL